LRLESLELFLPGLFGVLLGTVAALNQNGAVDFGVMSLAMVGITIPTWASAFAQNLSSKNAWRASREEGKCTNTTDVRQGQPQQKPGTRATYGCRYSTARLLYTATVVED